MILKDDALYYQWVDYMTNNEIQKYKKQKNDINLYKSPAIQYTLDEKNKKECYYNYYYITPDVVEWWSNENEDF